VFFSFTIVTAATELLRPGWFDQSGFLWLLVPATVMFGVGIYDDFRPLSPRFKLFVQVVCGATLFFWLRWTPLGFFLRNIEFGEVGLLVGTIVWVVVVSNSINLIDGVDGLAGGTAVLTLTAIVCLACRAGRSEVAVLAVILIGSLLGFLRFNFNPATMFLGDGGSLFVGFMISVFGIIWGGSRALASTVGIAIAILALPLAETGVSVSRRFLSGRPLFSPDREHMHHKLLDRGLSQRQAVLVLYAMALICGLSGISIAIGGPYVFAISFVILTVILGLGLFTLGYVEFLEVGRLAKRLLEQRRVMANDVVLRRLIKRIQCTGCIGEIVDELRLSLSAMRFDGLELRIAPWLGEHIRCERRTAGMRWGCALESKVLHAACWTMELELDSTSYGSLGCLRLASKVERGSLLFDANLLVSELQPAVVSALERCIVRCAGVRDSKPATWVGGTNKPITTVLENRERLGKQHLRAQGVSKTQAND
jgi:UDP-GlcNAc:undecaprenyl-phosphate GlcNAc-1-phosphate transferase